MGRIGVAGAFILARAQAEFCRRSFPGFAAALCALFLAACAGAPRATFDLSSASGILRAKTAGPQLAVAMPDATLPANSDRIVVRSDQQSVAYLEGAQWADKLPVLVQSRLIESFQNAHALRAVGRPGMLADYTLATTLRRFELDPARGVASVEISAELTSASSGRVIAGRLFARSVPAPATAPEQAAAALDAASRQVMREIVLWTAQLI